MATPNQISKPHIEEQKICQTKQTKLIFVEEAFDLIRDNLEEHEKRGHYLFHVVRCRL